MLHVHAFITARLYKSYVYPNQKSLYGILVPNYCLVHSSKLQKSFFYLIQSNPLRSILKRIDSESVRYPAIIHVVAYDNRNRKLGISTTPTKAKLGLH